MSLAIVKVTPQNVRVRISTRYPDETREWNIDRRAYGTIGSIVARSDDGGRCTIGSFRSADGAQMQPDYARLRTFLKAS